MAAYTPCKGVAAVELRLHVGLAQDEEECDWNVIRVKPHYDDIVKRRKAK